MISSSFSFIRYELLVSFEIGRVVALLLSVCPIDAYEIGGGVGRDLPSFVKRLHVIMERRVGDVSGELPHIGHAEELLRAHLVHEDVGIAERLHLTPRS